jgi:hypothetical protein
MSEPYPRTIEPGVSNLLVCLPSDNPIAGDTMSAVPANEIQRNCGKPDARNPLRTLAEAHAADSKKVCSFASGDGR